MPAYLQLEGIEGEVVVMATVGVDGSVSDVKILKDIGGGCGLEVVRVVRAMRFQPATQNGYPRALTMTIPVVFHLN